MAAVVHEPPFPAEDAVFTPPDSLPSEVQQLVDAPAALTTPPAQASTTAAATTAAEEGGGGQPDKQQPPGLKARPRRTNCRRQLGAGMVHGDLALALMNPSRNSFASVEVVAEAPQFRKSTKPANRKREANESLGSREGGDDKGASSPSSPTNDGASSGAGA